MAAKQTKKDHKQDDQSFASTSTSSSKFSMDKSSITALASVVGASVAVGSALFATRERWMPAAKELTDEFAAAFAGQETDRDNFDQTRNAGRDSMRDDPGEDYDDIDEMADASFPASDPPSFTPGRA